MELTRFYLELQKDPHGPEVGMFIGNLPANLSQRQYETLLLDLLDEGCKFSSIGPIYYEYGSMVITFDNSRASVQAYELLKSSYHEEKKLLGKYGFFVNLTILKNPILVLVMLLPTVKPSMLPPTVCPLLVFVNGKSGGGQGLQLISSFRKLLNPHQVFDLCNGGPLCG